MWEPHPDWAPIPAGRGSLTVGTWRAEDADGSWLVKRVAAPSPDDPPLLRRPDHPGYWRREVEVALGALDLRGLVPPQVHRVEEDETGWTLWSRWVERAPVPTDVVGTALGRFAGTTLPAAPWLARRLLAERVALAEPRGGWPTLQRTVVADVADHFWRRRGSLLGRYDALPTVPAHGDVVPANLLAVRAGDVLTADWSALGRAPAGADLGYLALSTPDGLTALIDPYLAGLADAGVVADGDEVAWAARVMIAYTVLPRAEWALARVAPGEGPLEAKLRHPAVAPTLRSLQRHLPDLEALLTDRPGLSPTRTRSR
ncbi:MAG: phosphotransferase [Marmoricola sp.]